MLFDHDGNRKYVTTLEWEAFIAASEKAGGELCTFGLMLAYSGARLSEALSLTPRRIDYAAQAVVIRTLKRRRSDVFRSVPLPAHFLDQLQLVHDIRRQQRIPELADQLLWKWCRTTAWAKIKFLMKEANIVGACAMPKGLRHGLAVKGTAEARVPLNIVQKWLGHARIETTAIYADAIGSEERALASLLWRTPPR
jgi:integrase